MHCPRCNAAIDPNVRFCPKCGAAVSPREAAAAALTAGTKGDEEAERDLWEGGYSSKAMVGTWVLLAVVSIAVIALTVVLTTVGTLGVALLVALPVVLGVVAVLWIIGGIVLLVRKWSVRYKLTTQRLVLRRGLLSATTDRIELIDVDDITYHQGVVERMLGVGKIQL